jgi:AcrR family transcriptional regulator
VSRITKNPDERKEEIIDTAQKLFIEKGYAETKISDIVKKLKVSQGVFYYYFKSKEEIVDYIVDRYIKLISEDTSDIIKNNKINVDKKLRALSEVQLKVNMAENNRIHSIKGVDIHERILKKLILDYVPLMVSAFHESGSKETQYLIELFVSTANVLFDPGIFQWNKAERNNRIDFLISFMEKNLGFKEGSLEFYKQLMGYAN